MIIMILEQVLTSFWGIICFLIALGLGVLLFFLNKRVENGIFLVAKSAQNTLPTAEFPKEFVQGQIDARRSLFGSFACTVGMIIMLLAPLFFINTEDRGATLETGEKLSVSAVSEEMQKILLTEDTVDVKALSAFLTEHKNDETLGNAASSIASMFDAATASNAPADVPDVIEGPSVEPEEEVQTPAEPPATTKAAAKWDAAKKWAETK